MLSRVTLEKIDAVRERTGASYRACQQALHAVGGDVVAAIVRLEGGTPEWSLSPSEGVTGRMLHVLGEGWRTHLAVRRGGSTVVEIPAVLGLASAALFPRATAIGVLAALAARCALVVERAPAQV